MTKIGINGFGRIGRMVMRNLREDKLRLQAGLVAALTHTLYEQISSTCYSTRKKA